MTNNDIHTIVNNCLLSIEGNTYIVNTAQMTLRPNAVPTVNCSVIIGRQLNSTDSAFYTKSDKLIKCKPGTEASLSLQLFVDGQGEITIQLFKGYVSSVTLSAVAGGGAASALYYSVGVGLVHVSAGLNAYAIGSRVVLPRGSVRQPFFMTDNTTSLDKGGNIDSKGLAEYKVAEHIMEIVKMFIKWETGQMGSSAPPEVPLTADAEYTLNFPSPVGDIAQPLITDYIRNTTVRYIEAAYNGGNFFSLLSALCEAFYFTILPTLDGLTITHCLPVFKHGENDIVLKNRGLFSYQDTLHHQSVAPPDAVWVPFERLPQYIKNQDDGQKAIYNPLYGTTEQPHMSYFKYPDLGDPAKNGLIIEPPMFLKLLLLSDLDTPSVSSSVPKKVLVTEAPKKQTQEDSRSGDDLTQKLGEIIAKLMYCMYAYNTNSVNVSVSLPYLTNIGYDLYSLVGRLICLDTVINNVPSKQVGYCSAVTFSLNRPNNQLQLDLTLTNVRTYEIDQELSISKSDNLIYTFSKNGE